MPRASALRSSAASPVRLSQTASACTLPTLQHERLRLATLAGSDRLHGAAGRDRGVILLKDRSAVRLDGEFIAMLDQQPVGAFAPFPVVGHPDQHEAAMQPLAFERELEIALRQAPARGSSFPPAPNSRGPTA